MQSLVVAGGWPIFARWVGPTSLPSSVVLPQGHFPGISLSANTKHTTKSSWGPLISVQSHWPMSILSPCPSGRRQHSWALIG